MRRTNVICLSLALVVSGCGTVDSLTNSTSTDSSSSGDYLGSAAKSSSEYAGTYVLDSMEVMGSSGTLFMYVLAGRCTITLSASDASGWRTLTNNSYCRIGTSTYNSIVSEKAVSRVQLNSLGSVINVDESATQTTTPPPKDVTFIDSSMVFGYSTLTAKFTVETGGERLYQTMNYDKE